MTDKERLLFERNDVLCATNKLPCSGVCRKKNLYRNSTVGKKKMRIVCTSAYTPNDFKRR